MCKLCVFVWAAVATCVALVAIRAGVGVSPDPAPAALVTTSQEQTGRRDDQDQDRRLLGREIVRVDDVVYATITQDGAPSIELAMDTAFAAQSNGAPMPVAVYIHGGGFRTGDKSDGRVLMQVLARGGYFAVSVGYRLSETAEYPGAVHDCKAAIRFLRANAEQLAIDPDRIGVFGHSAGGHLAAYLALTGNAPQTHGEVGVTGVSSAVHCAVPISGIFNFAESGNGGERLRYWLGDATGDAWAKRLKEASPVSWVDAADPPMLLIHGTADRLVPAKQSQDLHQKLETAGVASTLRLVDGEGHMIRDRSVYMDVLKFFDEHLGGDAMRVFSSVNRPASNNRDAT